MSGSINGVATMTVKSDRNAVTRSSRPCGKRMDLILRGAFEMTHVWTQYASVQAENRFRNS
jgi:hypothetical protein